MGLGSGFSDIALIVDLQRAVGFVSEFSYKALIVGLVSRFSYTS